VGGGPGLVWMCGESLHFCCGAVVGGPFAGGLPSVFLRTFFFQSVLFFRCGRNRHDRLSGNTGTGGQARNICEVKIDECGNSDSNCDSDRWFSLWFAQDMFSRYV